jgi:phosphoribosyl 1,2-cyclic phosphodiesterase
MRVRVLASGSGGNLSLYESDGFRLLVDAGIDPGGLASRLRSVGAEYTEPDALIVTHGHADHCAHAGEFAERAGIPTYMTEATLRVTKLKGERNVIPYSTRDPISIGPFRVTPCPLPHDRAQVALRIAHDRCAAVIATDLGEVPADLLSLLEGAQLALIESNHDREMLERGPYPPFIKRRVASARGHLSNAQCHELLRRLPASVDTVVLMHLSEKNNLPQLALDSAADALSDRATTLLAAKQYDRLSIDLRAPTEHAPDAPLIVDRAKVSAIAREIAAAPRRAGKGRALEGQLALDFGE